MTHILRQPLPTSSTCQPPSQATTLALLLHVKTSGREVGRVGRVEKTRLLQFNGCLVDRAWVEGERTAEGERELTSTLERQELLGRRLSMEVVGVPRGHIHGRMGGATPPCSM